MTPEPFTVTTIDNIGRAYKDFHVREGNYDGPGWYVYGRNPYFYGGNLVTLCARPDVKPRQTKHFTARVRRGFHTKREAQMVADILNARDDCWGLVDWSYSRPCHDISRFAIAA